MGVLFIENTPDGIGFMLLIRKYRGNGAGCPWVFKLRHACDSLLSVGNSIGNQFIISGVVGQY